MDLLLYQVALLDPYTDRSTNTEKTNYFIKLKTKEFRCYIFDAQKMKYQPHSHPCQEDPIKKEI